MLSRCHCLGKLLLTEQHLWPGKAAAGWAAAGQGNSGSVVSVAGHCLRLIWASIRHRWLMDGWTHSSWESTLPGGALSHLKKYPLGEFYFPREASESFSQPAFQVCLLRVSGTMAVAGDTTPSWASREGGRRHVPQTLSPSLTFVNG